MILQMVNTRASYIALDTEDEVLEAVEHNFFEIDYSVEYDTEKRFRIIFELEVGHKNDFRLEVDYIASFETSGVIDDTFKGSSFPKINAPAIAFPFLRAFVSNLTLNAGFNPVMLPSINFIKLAKKKESS